MVVFTAAATGAAGALYVAVLFHGLAASVWPQAALGAVLLALVAGGLGALAVGCAPAPRAERVRRLATELLGLAGALGAAAIATLPRATASVVPGGECGLLSLPLPFLALAAAPLTLVGAVASAWVGAGEHRRFGWLLCGAGAGWLAAAALAGSSLAVRTPWFGGPTLAWEPARGGALKLRVDGGLRVDTVAPEAPPLAYLPPADASGASDALLVGFPNGSVLAALLAQPGVRLTILEEDAELFGATLRRWPELEAARASGRVRFLAGNPRSLLARSTQRYGLIALSQGVSADAYRCRALLFRADHRWTVEAFRAYLARLLPDGYLLAERTATGRVVATLREAAGLPASEFRHRLVVLGLRGGLSSQCWYRPAGLSDEAGRNAARYNATLRGTRLFYLPTKFRMKNFYDRLVGDERLESLAFSTPLDLSPTTDERPFFDDVDRLTISPAGRSLPEEPPAEKPTTALRVIPPGDRGLWGVVLAGLAAGVALVAAGRHGAGRGAAPGVRAAALALGACLSLTLQSFAAWARWLAPSASLAGTGVAALLLAAGGGWLAAGARSGRSSRLSALGALLALGAGAGYGAAAAVLHLDSAPAAAVVIAAGALLGGLLGACLRGAALTWEGRCPGSPHLAAGLLLWSAPLAWAAGTLAATHFGYRLLWALAAVAVAVVWRLLRQEAPAGPGRPKGSAT